MKKFLASATIFTKLLLLVIFSGMHFFQVNAFNDIPCHEAAVNIDIPEDPLKCKLCKDSKNILNQNFILCTELKEKKVSKNNSYNFLSLNFSENILIKKLVSFKLLKSNSPPLKNISKNYLNFKKSVQLRV